MCSHGMWQVDDEEVRGCALLPQQPGRADDSIVMNTLSTSVAELFFFIFI